MNRKSIILIFVLILWSSQYQANIRVKESLLFQKIPSVITASREVVIVLESPATARIIIRQDIVHSGYNSVTQLLRFVAGVDFSKKGAAGFSIGMRGIISIFNGT